jgi:hypothetical protein
MLALALQVHRGEGAGEDHGSIAVVGMLEMAFAHPPMPPLLVPLPPSPFPLSSCSGRKEDARMSAFVKALQAAKLRPVNSGMSMLSCGPDVHFPDDIVEGRGTLLVREFYSALLQRMAAGRGWLLTGVPGTCKSWFVWYAMHSLLQQPDPPAIVWQMLRQGHCVLFKGGKAFIGAITEFKEELDLASTWRVKAQSQLPLA